MTEKIPFAPQTSSSSTQPEYPLVASTTLHSWSLSGSDSPADQSQTIQSPPPAALPQETAAVVEDDTSDHKGSPQQDEQLGTDVRTPVLSTTTSFRSDTAGAIAADSAQPTPLQETSATSQPRKTLRLSYKDELRLAAKETRNRSGTRNTAFEKAKAAMKRRRLKRKGMLFKDGRQDIFALWRNEPTNADGLPHVSPPGTNDREAANGSPNLTNLAESQQAWFHGRPGAGDLPDAERTAPGGGDALHYDNVTNAIPRPTSSTQELLLYPLALLLFITLLVVLIMALAMKPASSTAGRNVNAKSLVCTSKNCYQDAEYLSGLLSWDIDDPCDSFQPFVCRRWTSILKDSPLTQSISSDDVYLSSIEQWAQVIYHNRPQHFGIPAPLRNFTEKCLNTEQIESDGWNLLLEFMFNSSLEGFPLTPPVRGRLNIWTTAASLLRKTGTAALVSVSVASHPFIESRDVPLVSPPRTLISSGIDIEEATRMYTAAVLSAVRSLKKDYVPPVHTMKTVEFARTFEILNELKVPETKPEVIFTEPQSELVEFLNEVISGVPSIMFIKNQAKIWIRAPHIVTQIVELARNTEPYVVFNYLCVRLMVQMSPFIPPSKALTDFHSTLTYGKVRTGVPRSHICLRAVEKAAFPLFYASFLSIFGLRHELVLRRFASLVKDTAEGFVTSVESSALFGKRARTTIKRIVSNINFQVLGPSWLKDGLISMKYFSPTSNATAFEAYVELHERMFVETLSLGSSGRWTHSAFSTTCWYERNPSTIYVPALVFNITLSLNEKSLHVCRAAARVISCIFDAIQAETNTTSLESWLTEVAAPKLHDTLTCYGLDVPNLPPRSLRDALTIEFAFRHFEKSVKKSSNSLHLRLAQGKVLTSSQLFFVQLMLQRCEKKGGLDTLALGSAHDLNVVLSRDANFAAAFNCSQGSPMSKGKKCSLYRN